MSKISYLRGDLVSLAKTDQFDVIVIGANCNYSHDSPLTKGLSDIFHLSDNKSKEPVIDWLGCLSWRGGDKPGKSIILVEAFVLQHDDLAKRPFDYDAYKVCMKKINRIFKGKKIAMPKIGCHLAGGDWDILEQITENLLGDCDVTVVEYGS